VPVDESRRTVTAEPAGAILDVVDWRRRIWSLYAEVRRISRSDPAAAHALWCRARNGLFARHPASPLPPSAREAFRGLPVAGYDPDWRFELSVDGAEPMAISLSAGSDGDVPFERLGHLSLPGGETLDVWALQSYGGGIFLPVRDGLSGRSGGTYGGGRYLLDTIKGADLGVAGDGHGLVVDFNFAYNPSCAYNPEWACPLAPRGNVLNMEIPVGELYEQ
jgi:uncharacterized protein (DUF1684 family)